MSQLSFRARRVLASVALLVLAGGGIAWSYLAGPLAGSPPGCTALLVPPGVDPDDSDQVQSFSMTPEQADNAATIAGVGDKLGMPSHAVTVAIATALQESGLHNLTYGDRDSIGLFQQRPSQGWGTVEQISDPVYAATAFYRRLRQQPDWTDIEVTEAAQLVQRSAAPDAYAQWEPQARVMAAAFTGEDEATVACHDLVPGPSTDVLVTLAKRELGTAALSGPQPRARGRAISAWLVAHASRVAVDRVSFDGMTWTAASGRWDRGGPPDGTLSLHLVGAAE